MDQFTKDPHNSYAQACFRASIDFDEVIDDDKLPDRPGFLQTYGVRLTLQCPETERTCALERRHDFRIMQTPISREHRDQLWITPEFTKTDGLRIRVWRSAIWATEASFVDRTLWLALQEYGSTLQFRYVRLTAAGHSVQSELIRDTDGLYGRIEVPEGVWTESSGLRHWTVDAVTADGRTWRVGWALPGGSGAGREIVSAEGSLRLTRTNQGNITSDRRSVVVRSRRCALRCRLRLSGVSCPHQLSGCAACL